MNEGQARGANVEATRVPVETTVGHIRVWGYVGALNMKCPCGWEKENRPTDRTARTHVRRGCPYAHPLQLRLTSGEESA